MAQAGYAGLEVTAPWVGMLVPAGTPAPVVSRLADEIRKSLAKPDIRAKMKEQGAVIVGDTPSEFAAFLKKDQERWAQVIKASGVKAE
jgi:tripartite-type tricarboxylate transporter receptor subunit TctC